ncbi:MAG: hypothetical protein IPL32_03560 [Chloracidobacterium sp.]|nr:hypothetical protein [Chloracidobacterium sp.]
MVKSSIQSSDNYVGASIHLVEKITQASLTHLIELLRLKLGQKKVVRLVVTDDEYQDVEEYASGVGLSLAHSVSRLKEIEVTATGDRFTTSVDWDDPEGRSFSVFLGSEKLVQEYAEADSGRFTSNDIGYLLEIPPCCVESYNRLQNGRDWLSAWLQGVIGDKPFNRYGNHLASYIGTCNLAGDFLPCHITCRLTIESAHQGYEVAKRFRLLPLIDETIRYLTVPVVVVGENLIFLHGGTKSQEVYSHYEFKSGAITIQGPDGVSLQQYLRGSNCVKSVPGGVIFGRSGHFNLCPDRDFGQRALLLMFL